ncbi:inositol monophosphatase family protein [Haloglycomyces albus]|uniref:inositol monophosphatase family protein n=1 Tax=Haloglycomyces albus TaxID=526067 RepID=UPI00046C8ED0|nr:inositol monophosphatase family protein [Haloglycomyces albus]
MDTNYYLRLARYAVQQAEEIISESTDRSELTYKGDRDFASAVDMRVEESIRARLTTESPECSFLGEEYGLQKGHSDELIWVLDPIDGTSNFVHGNPLYSISLSLLSEGEPAVGVVSIPQLHHQFTAAVGQGAAINETTTHCSSTKELRSSIISTGDFAVGKGAIEKNHERFELHHQLVPTVERVRMFGSAAIDLCWVAAGWTDGCVVMSGKIWDVAAGIVIAREAGADVLNGDGEQYDSNSETMIASTPAITDELVQVVKTAANWQNHSSVP